MKQSKSTRTAGRTQRKAKPAPGRKAASRPAAGRKTASRASAAGKAARAVATTTVGPMVLPAECVISSVDEIKTELVQRLGSDIEITIDASAVQRIDTASLQVLAAFARDRRAAGRLFAWRGVPAAVSDAAALLNLSETLELDAAAAGSADAATAGIDTDGSTVLA